MPDSRFFETLGPLNLAQLAEISGARLTEAVDVRLQVRRVAPLGRAVDGDVSFLGDKRYLDDLKSTKASVVFASEAHAALAPASCCVLITPEPQAAYARTANHLHQPLRHAANTAAIHPDSRVEDGVTIAHGVVIGQYASIGAGTEIGANAVIGPGVNIGRNCRIGANSTIGFAMIGDRVRIYANAVIGQEGFGVTGSRTGSLDVPQLGRVIIQDDVTIGAGSCVDRGAWDDTVIGEQTKIDNLVQVGHNVRLGRNCIIAAQTGISGSVVVGDGVMFGGSAGVADHIRIGDGARIAAASGVMKDIPAGEAVCGAPARPLRQFMREIAWVSRQVSARKRNGADD